VKKYIGKPTVQLQKENLMCGSEALFIKEER
jgi:hypothetical protein